VPADELEFATSQLILTADSCLTQRARLSAEGSARHPHLPGSLLGCRLSSNVAWREAVDRAVPYGPTPTLPTAPDDTKQLENVYVSTGP